MTLFRIDRTEMCGPDDLLCAFLCSPYVVCWCVNTHTYSEYILIQSTRKNKAIHTR